ncbi:hypothetical protein KI387_000305, partial [Taxus chinensis]
ARQQLTMRDRMPPLLVQMRPHVSAAHWANHARGGTRWSSEVQSDRERSQPDGRPHREMGSGDQCVPSPDWGDDRHIGG